jgi:acyl dehydratase
MSVSLPVGTELPAQNFWVTRADLVRYAGASGDFNPIHWSDRFATSVGLPGVIAHGMYTMALGSQALVEWAGDPSAVIEYGVRFARPVVVPDDDDGVEVVVTGVVKGASVDGFAQIDISATCNGEKVLGLAKAVLRVPAA